MAAKRLKKKPKKQLKRKKKGKLKRRDNDPNGVQ